MPELKNAFIKGRMNKDLDERLVPNGEYRDAVNIEVTTSEGGGVGDSGNVGAIKNILGNEEISSGSIVIPSDAKVIGHVVDNRSNKVYWLVWSSTKDFILEYDESNIRVVVCDTRKPRTRLSFSNNTKVTGINIIGDMLFWTDNVSEPKGINVKDFKDATALTNAATLQSTTQLNSADYKEEHITVIKKSPLSSPSIDIKVSSREFPVTNLSTTSTNLYSRDIGDSFSITLIQSRSSIKRGDILDIVYQEEILEEGYVEEHKITAKVVSTTSGGRLINVTVLTKSEKIPDASHNWDVDLQQEDPFYELKFPRFAYRWKYKNGEYSTFSPFSEVAFLPGEYNFDFKNGFNLGMQNTARKISIENFETPPYNVVEMDILFKESVGTNVYKAETIKKEEFENIDWSTYKFEIESEIVNSVIEANQILRPWDNVPRKAKAQEITGNRLVYGNYLQNYNVAKTPLINASYSARPGNTKQTLKSDREYQIGVVWKDYYGRETPVISSKNSIVKVPDSESKNENQLSIIVDKSTKPSWATHYKYFIKETSQPYYNLAASKFYEDREGFYWIAFNSTERNKIAEDDYLIIKKSIGQDVAAGSHDKFKVLDISNEFPNFLQHEEKILEFRPGLIFDSWYGGRANQTVKWASLPNGRGHQAGQMGITPIKGGDRVLLSEHSNNGGWEPGKADVVLNEAASGTKEVFIRFGVSGESSMTNLYKVDNFKIHHPGHDEIEIIIDGEFGEDCDILYHESAVFGDTNVNLRTNLKIIKRGVFYQLVEKVPIESAENEFLGKFFVKIKKENSLNEIIQSNLSTNNENYKFVATVGFNGKASNTNYRRYFIRYGGKAGNPNTSLRPESGGAWGEGRRPEGGQSEDPYWSTDEKTKFHISLETFAHGPKSDTDNAQGQLNYEYDPFYNKVRVGQYVSFHVYDTYKTQHNPARKYKIKTVAIWDNTKDNHDWARIHLELEDNLEHDIHFYTQGGSDGTQEGVQPKNWRKQTWMTLWEDAVVTEGSLTNPAIFETEPKEGVELNIYHETQETWDASTDLGSTNNLKWFNAFSFGNGVESNRIRDDFNAPTIDKGPKVSTTLDEPYDEENRETGLIYSGIFNSTSGVNNLNQFIAAEKITKDLNPTFGSIQKLYSKETNLIAFCEDKVINILANKDALYNADGNPNLIATNRVLGNATPFVGDFGISKNPESFAAYGFRIYFSDKSRGSIMRLSRDGLTPISNAGMKGYFKTNLAAATNVLGYYNAQKDAYEIALNNDIVEFKESIAGWSTRKNYNNKTPEGGFTLNNRFYLFYQGKLWEHSNATRNTFFGASSASKSSIKFVYNQEASKIKNFKTLSYEGDTGWSCPSIITDQQDGKVPTFIKEEGKYYNFIKGIENTWNETTQSGKLDTSEFSTQGIGTLGSISGDTDTTEFTLTIVENNDD